MNFVVSYLSCINIFTSRAWADLTLANVFSGSVVAVTKNNVHKNRSRESTMRGWCTRSSSQFARAAVSMSWMNLSTHGGQLQRVLSELLEMVLVAVDHIQWLTIPHFTLVSCCCFVMLVIHSICNLFLEECDGLGSGFHATKG